MIPRTLSVKEAANVLKVQPRTVRIWISAGKLRASKAGKGYIIFEPEVRKLLTPEKPSVEAQDDTTKRERITRMRGILRGTGVGTEALLKEREKELEQEQKGSHCQL